MKSKLSFNERFRRTVRAGLVSVLANALFGTVKLLAGVLGHSYALIADAMESLLDVGGSLVIVSGVRIAAQPPDEKHPYGHGKAEPLAAAALALMMIGASVVLAIESIDKIRTPHPLPAPFTLVVLIIVIIAKATLSRYLQRVADENESAAVKADAWHQWADVIVSSAAFIGVAIAVWNGPGYEAADDWAALVACVVIAFNAYLVLRPAVNDILDAAPPAELELRIREIAGGVSGVSGVEKCFVRRYGAFLVVDLHVEVDPQLTVLQAHDIAHGVKDALRDSELTVSDVLVHIEPAPSGVQSG